jgi:hypothetical protein
MRKLFAAGVIATVLAASAAFALDASPTQPIMGTEGPDIPQDDSHPADQGIEGHPPDGQRSTLGGGPREPDVR